MDIERENEMLARLNRIGDRMAAAVQANDDWKRARDCGVENISFPRGDLGLLYQLLRDLEWSQQRKAAQIQPFVSVMVGRACPRCFGLHPDDFTPEHFPASANGHFEECRFVAMIRLLRSALGAIE